MVQSTPTSPRPVVLVHGVGIGARSMARLAQALERDGRRTVVVDRPGYGATPGPSTVAEQAEWLVEICRSAEVGVVDLVGVSGGATVGLAAACTAPATFGRVVLHEPLVGPLAPGLHATIVESAGRLAADPSTDALLSFIRRLVGPETMEHLDVDLVDGLVRAAETVRGEVPSFERFAPSTEDLSGLGASNVDVVTTVGTAREAPSRREAAAVLADLADATVVELPTCGHLAQVDDPVALADVLGRVEKELCAP